MGSLRGRKFYRVGDRRLLALQLGQGFAHHLLGEARTFAALAGHAGGLSHFAIAAATVINRFADLPIGDASAEADIHKVRTIAD